MKALLMPPPTPEDSIYAIIDLGYTYTLMQNSGYKSFYNGAMTEHIPSSIEQFRDRREYHLSLFPLNKEAMIDSQPEDQAGGQLLQNIPNPFFNSTKIYYEVFEEGVVDVKVYSHLGNMVWSDEYQNSNPGKNSMEFNANNLPAGIYYYVLSVDGVVVDSKKMILVK